MKFYTSTDHDIKYHKIESGERIKFCDLEINHLLNIIRAIERKAILGIYVRYKSDEFRCSDPVFGTTDDYDYVKRHKGEEALKIMRYHDYRNELARRIIDDLSRKMIDGDGRY